MLNQRMMATAVIKKNGKFLLLKRGGRTKLYHGRWQFPEGGIKKGETPEQALARELREETGLRVERARRLGVRTSAIKYFGQKVWHFKRTFYAVKTTGKIKLSSKHSEHGWFSKKEVKRLRLLEGLKYGSFRNLL
ncbi:MAG: NUDIX domain-containing protein [Candidatus Aenigmatarchaeota archaeon]